MNVVIQGGLYGDFTLETAYEYAKRDFITKVIISTWEGEEIFQNDIKSDKIVVLKSKMPENHGPGNMNLQIVSSRNGIDLCDDGVVVKTRSDQHLYPPSIYKWKEYFEKNQDRETLRYIDGKKQKSLVFLIGNNKTHPFHPQDHFFWGYKQDVERIFNIPLWNDPPWTWRDAPIKFNERLRPNIYLGIHYYRQFYPEVEKFLLNPNEYLLDNAPKYQEAMDFYTPRRDSIFLPMPRIEMWWAKQNSGYWYSYEKGGEYYAD
tara:strand:+ start:538 stop:1320 length:783 start_codon:yes stop_codon:yes gene_type:complete